MQKKPPSDGGSGRVSTLMPKVRDLLEQRGFKLPVPEKQAGPGSKKSGCKAKARSKLESNLGSPEAAAAVASQATSDEASGTAVRKPRPSKQCASSRPIGDVGGGHGSSSSGGESPEGGENDNANANYPTPNTQYPNTQYRKHGKISDDPKYQNTFRDNYQISNF